MMIKLAILCLGAFALVSSEGVCKMNSGDKRNGERWNNGRFVFECIVESEWKWTYKTVGCVTDKGIEIPVGSEKFEKGEAYDYLCKCKDSGGKVNKECNVAQNSSCFMNGVKYSYKKTWRDGEYEYICDGAPGVKMNGCYDDDGKRYNLREDYPIKNGRYMFKCGGGFSGCVLPDTKETLPAGQTKKIDNYKYECYLENGKFGMRSSWEN